MDLGSKSMWPCRGLQSMPHSSQPMKLRARPDHRARYKSLPSRASLKTTNHTGSQTSDEKAYGDKVCHIKD